MGMNVKAFSGFDSSQAQIKEMEEHVMATRTAWLNWSSRGSEWVLRLYEDEGGWRYENSWKIEERGEDEDGNSLDVVSDAALCYLANLQDDGYRLKVTLDGNYTQRGMED